MGQIEEEVEDACGETAFLLAFAATAAVAGIGMSRGLLRIVVDWRVHHDLF